MKATERQVRTFEAETELMIRKAERTGPAGKTPRQKDPNSITTPRVQLWQNGIMLTIVSQQEAIEAVIAGRAWVVSKQAVECYD